MHGLQPRTVSPRASMFSQLNALDTQYWVTHTCNSIHLQWDLFYVTWHSFRRRVLQVTLPTLCPSTSFSLWLQLSSILRHTGFLSERKMLLWTHSTMGMLKNTSRTEGPSSMSWYHVGQGMRETKLFPQQCMAEELHGLSSNPAHRATEMQKPEQASWIPNSGLKQWH